MNTPSSAPFWHLYVPKLVSVLRRGYGWADFRGDVVAALTVAVVALPLSMALAIASGASPEKGLHTAIIAGFLISALGGSRVQIGGPTAAFIPVVFVVIEKFGYGGLILCTLLAGLMLIAAGLLRLGTLMKFVPQPVIVGFTAGIAVTILSSQIKDALGLDVAKVPAEFFARWETYLQHLDSADLATIALTIGSILSIMVLRRIRQTAPVFLIVVLLGSVLVAVFGWDVSTIATRFPEGIPSSLPSFELPHIPFERTMELFPASFTIAFLAGVESLLSAVVADGMIGGRHRSNAELVGQGVANVASALFGGLPATGAISRTATNVRAGARSPIAGMLHTVFLLLFMLVATRWMGYVPLPVLAAVLLVVAWNMAELQHIRHLLRGPVGDRLVLLVTFMLTVMFDLTIAIEAGVVLASFLFMHRMSQMVEVASGEKLIEEDQPDSLEARPDPRAGLPTGVEVFQISGPLFYAVTYRLDDVLDQLFSPPQWFVLRLDGVPMTDASGATALKQFLDRCQKQHIKAIFVGLREQPKRVLSDMHVLEHPQLIAHVATLAEAKARVSAP